jgi:hypothetical protein
MKREIYSVAHFPPSDLSHMMAGIPPDKDFSNAKPTNQVNANTFLTWVDPFVRGLTEEDIGFLKEKVRPSEYFYLYIYILTYTGRPHNSICHAPSRQEALQRDLG